jgi:nicotinamidase/pyrazinamidase
MISLTPYDALLIADIQNDFLLGGALEISGGDAILPILRTIFSGFGCAVFLSS